MIATGQSFASHSETDRAALRRITEIVQLAFQKDPSWGELIYPGGEITDKSREYWEFFIRSAQRYPWTFLNAERTATSVWFPPNSLELTPEEEEALPELALRLLGKERADELFQIIAEFEKTTPAGEYFYLSILAVDPAHSNKGHGMKLLAENLELIDQTGMPSYLESSNPANDVRYARLGYTPLGRIDLPSGLSITTMWREPSK